jgi:flagellar biosynthesis protein
VALRYHPQAPYLDAAPRLVAKGEGLLADRILMLAKQHGIPVERDPDLLAALAPLQVDRVLPPELFKAVAIMLAALYRANGQADRFRS